MCCVLETNEYINLKERLIELSDKENCFQIVTYDSTINYLIKKQSCTKYFIINALGSKQIQEKDSIAIKFYDKTIGVSIKKIN